MPRRRVRRWLTLSGATLSGTPAQANVGTHNVVITVSDGTAAPVAQSFQIVVADANDPPVFTSTAPTNATQGVGYTYTATATDPDGNTLTFAAPTRPSWLTLSGATLSGTPGQANVGTHNVTITVSDGTAAPVAQSFQIVVANVNDPPVFTSTAPTTATQGVTYSYTAMATDPDGNTLTFAAPTLPAWLTLSGATLSGTPGQANVGTHSVMITVSDGTAAPVAQSFQIVVADANDPPVFTSTAPTTATQGVAYSYTATATDLDGNTLTFAAPTLPAWLTLSGATLSGTPGQANVGTHSVTITVSDGTAAPVAQSFQIVVADANDPPVFTDGRRRHRARRARQSSTGVAVYYASTRDRRTRSFTDTVMPLTTLRRRRFPPGSDCPVRRSQALRVKPTSARTSHDHGVGWHRGAGRAIVPNRRRGRERSAGLHEHRADGRDPRSALYLYRDGQRSRWQHADICRADASGLAHAVAVRRSRARRLKPTSARTA